MFSKVFASAAVLLAISSQVNAHAAIAPALGVSGNPARSDVQRPSTAKPCGKIDPASTIDSSTPIQAAADGTFTATVTDFNAGRDGSRSVSGTVDATGAGTKFAGQVTVSTNGDPAPKTVGSDQITASLPAGTTCTGGAAGNLCLVSFKTTAGFGNCVVVSQGAATGAAAGTAAQNATGAAGTAAATTNSTAATGATTTTGKKNKNGKGAAAANAAGSNAGAAAQNAAGTASTGATTTTGRKNKHANAGAAGTDAGAAGAQAAGQGAATGQAAGDQAAAAETNAAKAKVNKAGTRAARALLAARDAPCDEEAPVVKRGIFQWIWA